MNKVLKYTFYNLFRSAWLIIYTIVFLLCSFAFLSISDSFEKAISSILTITIALVPLVSILFGVIYYYSSKEFVEILICQPINRISVFMGQLAGLSLSLLTCFIVGTSIPFLIYGILVNSSIGAFLQLIFAGTALTLIFSCFAFLIAVLNENRIRGFGLGLLTWLFFVAVYDAIFLFSLIVFQDYPLEPLTIALTLLNPIDMARVLVMLKLEISALLGYTGAVFKDFYETGKGLMAATFSYILWVAIPTGILIAKIKKKDF